VIQGLEYGGEKVIEDGEVKRDDGDDDDVVAGMGDPLR
jgi:hypothetical protein